MWRIGITNNTLQTVMVASALLLQSDLPLLATAEEKPTNTAHAQPVSATQNTPAVDKTEAESAIRKAKIVDPKASLEVIVYPNGHATVNTEQDSNWTSLDLKINSVLIAKTLTDVSKGKIKRILCLFYTDSTHKGGHVVTVAHGDLVAFGLGDESKDELVNSLIVSDWPPVPVGSNRSASSPAGTLPATLDKTTIYALGKARQALFVLGGVRVSAEDPMVVPVLKNVDTVSSLLTEGNLEKAVPIMNDLNDQVNELLENLRVIPTKPNPTTAQTDNSAQHSDDAAPKAVTEVPKPPRLFKQVKNLLFVERQVASRLDDILEPDTPHRGILFYLRVQICYLIKSLEASHKDVSKERAEYDVIETNLNLESLNRRQLNEKLRAIQRELNQAAL